MTLMMMMMIRMVKMIMVTLMTMILGAGAAAGDDGHGDGVLSPEIGWLRRSGRIVCDCNGALSAQGHVGASCVRFQPEVRSKATAVGRQGHS